MNIIRKVYYLPLLIISYKKKQRSERKMKIRISALTTKSEKALLNKMSMDDLRVMAYLSSDVVKGIVTIEQYREKEIQMINKYGFKVK